MNCVYMVEVPTDVIQLQIHFYIDKWFNGSMEKPILMLHCVPKHNAFSEHVFRVIQHSLWYERKSYMKSVGIYEDFYEKQLKTLGH